MDVTSQTCFAAIDLGDESHALCIVNALGEPVAALEFSNSVEDMDKMIVMLRQAGNVFGVAVERADHLVVVALLQAGFYVYVINPKVSCHWRKGARASGAKSDPSDARVLAHGLRTNYQDLKPLQPDDEQTRKLAMLCRDECRLIRQQTALVQQTKDALKQYFPAALEWFEDWTSPAARDFILAFPTPEKLVRASEKKLFGFLKIHHMNLTRQWQERIKNRQGIAERPTDPATVEAKSFLAVCLAKQLRSLQAALRAYRQRIEELFENHPDAFIFDSLPRSGKKLAPRLLAHFGTRRERFESARSLQQLSGCAPVTVTSGNKSKRPPKPHSGTVRIRRACQKPFRNTMFHFALQSILESAWARSYYDRARQAGQTHACALRNLGGKWLKIIYRMWLDRTPYREEQYLAALVRHGSPIAAQLAGQ
ncbi:MAG: IS110 family transposase [Planctomycetota bacterium]